MSLPFELRKLGNKGVFPPLGRVERRWGQILRERADLRTFLEKAHDRGLLLPLADLATVQGGVVTRANAYFVVRELSFEEIPARFRISKRDFERVRVIEDGLGTLHRCEAEYLRPILKGPESLVGPAEIAQTDLRLFDLRDLSKKELRERHANGALEYLRRGETVDYNVSEDRLKGGIPAQRSNVRGRKPYWYSIHTPSTTSA